MDLFYINIIYSPNRTFMELIINMANTFSLYHGTNILLIFQLIQKIFGSRKLLTYFVKRHAIWNKIQIKVNE